MGGFINPSLTLDIMYNLRRFSQSLINDKVIVQICTGDISKVIVRPTINGMENTLNLIGSCVLVILDLHTAEDMLFHHRCHGDSSKLQNISNCIRMRILPWQRGYHHLVTWNGNMT